MCIILALLNMHSLGAYRHKQLCEADSTNPQTRVQRVVEINADALAYDGIHFPCLCYDELPPKLNATQTGIALAGLPVQLPMHPSPVQKRGRFHPASTNPDRPL